MVEGFRDGERKPNLRLIRGLAGRPPMNAELAKEVEPIVREGMEEGRGTKDPREKVRLICLIAHVQAEVDGDSFSILKEAFKAADKLGDKALSAELLVEVASAFWTTDLDPLPVMERALEKAGEAPEGVEKQELLAGIAYSYAKLSDFARAERVLEGMGDAELRKEARKLIETLMP